MIGIATVPLGLDLLNVQFTSCLVFLIASSIRARKNRSRRQVMYIEKITCEAHKGTGDGSGALGAENDRRDRGDAR